MRSIDKQSRRMFASKAMSIFLNQYIQSNKKDTNMYMEDIANKSWMMADIMLKLESKIIKISIKEKLKNFFKGIL